MIKEIRYKNFKALRDATLPLGRFTLIVGANGTGKSTALKAFEVAKYPENFTWKELSIAGLKENENVMISWIVKDTIYERTWNFKGFIDQNYNNKAVKAVVEIYDSFDNEDFYNALVFSFDPEKIAEITLVKPNIELESDGTNLSGVLLQLQTSEDERFEELNREIQNWFPEFERIVFEFPEDGKVSFLLRSTFGKHKIKAKDLSDGTRLALAYLTLAYLPNPPKIVAFEEPEKGIHPRLLGNIQEAMYRLAYPENYGESREPIQVIATTHSPYLLDLYKDYAEEIVIAEKDENGVHFNKLIEMPYFREIVQDAPLGEVWFTGVLGGVPVQP